MKTLREYLSESIPSFFRKSEVKREIRRLSGNIVQKATVTLTNAQIKKLPSVGIEIVPAPGVGKMIHVLSGFVSIHIVVGGAYGNVTNTSLQLVMDDPITNYIYTSNALGFYTGLDQFSSFPMTQTENSFADFNNNPVASPYAIPENLPVEIWDFNGGNGGGDYTGGNDDNTLMVTIYYTIVDL